MAACPCDVYVGESGHDPVKEQDAGAVRIASTSEPGWSMTYLVECVSCGRRCTVKQSDGPSLQWKWVPHGVKRRRRTLG